MTCRHCHRRRANRPRGLCWTCSQQSSIRALYPSRSNSGRWADGGSMPAEALRRSLTQGCDGRQWLIVGVRPDGSELVIEEARGRRRAQKRAAQLRALLEGYVGIRVERIGETLSVAHATIDDERSSNT